MDLPPLPLPEGVHSQYVAANDLVVHFLDARPSAGTNPPMILLLHGFPELAFSWRSVMRPIADLGYRVIAPDLRGFGRTRLQSQASGTFHAPDYAEPIDAFSMSNYVRDALALVFALRYQEVACVVGHDFGSAVAAFCALTRPDVFQSVVLMSAPFLGAPTLPSGAPVTDVLSAQPLDAAKPNVHESLDALFAGMKPPRMHYQHYFSSSRAAHDMDLPPTSPEYRAFIRRYFHIKSAEWGPAAHPDVRPRALKGFTPDEVARLPVYYLMPRGVSMPEAVAAACEEHVGAAAGEGDTCGWMSEEELMVFVNEYGRTGFQSGLNKYRCVTNDIDIPLGATGKAKAHKDYMADLSLFSHLRITVPAIFIAGELDWGPYQYPGALARMRNELCTDMRDVIFVPNAGHWVQQEQPERVVDALALFLKQVKGVVSE